MGTENTYQLKEKIMQTLRITGPMLPAYISKSIGSDMLFTSAFLSELVSEKRILASHMRIGSSAIYYLKENQKDLEKYGESLKSKEKEAFILLKEKKFLEDEKQESPIKVALRQIRDFAFPFEKDGKIIWRYFITEESEYKQDKKEKPKEKKLDILDKKSEEKRKQEKPHIKNKQIKLKIIKKKASTKKSEQFFNKVKEFLINEQKEIIDILGVTKDNLILKIKDKDQEILLIALNKKRITETDITKAHKKSQELNLKYSILSLGDTSKKLENLIDALKDLSNIEKIQ